MNYLGSFPNHWEILGRYSQPEKKGLSIPCVSWHPRQGGLVCRKNLRSTHANLQQDISDKMYEVVVLNFHKLQNVCTSWDLESSDARGLDPAWHSEKLGITSEVRLSCPFLFLSSFCLHSGYEVNIVPPWATAWYSVELCLKATGPTSQWLNPPNKPSRSLQAFVTVTGNNPVLQSLSISSLFIFF